MSDSERLAVPALEGYLIEELLGRGGMGEVYRALDVGLDRQVALKVVRSELASDARFRERLVRESRLAASLDHPNVVPIYDAGEQGGRLFIAMRYVRGSDLRTLLRSEGALGAERAIAIAAQIADALDAAHESGLVHRDVKPSNVLLTAEHGREHCYLADFGLTQSASEQPAGDGQGLGTLDYVAPEQIRGESADGRADQYGLACLLFECLTGGVPYGRRSEVATLFAHLEEDPPAASERAPGLPAAVDDVLARGMAKEPGERFENCGALVAATAEALGVATAPASRGRLAVLLGVVAVALAAAVAALVIADGGKAAPPPPGALLRVDPRTNEVTSTKPVDGRPGNLVTAAGTVWMTDFRGGVLWHYEPVAGDLERITSSGEPRDVTALHNTIYVAADDQFGSGSVSRYDAETGVRGETFKGLTCSVESGAGMVWSAGCPFVHRLSTTPGPIRTLWSTFIPYAPNATVETVRGQIREMAYGGGSLWVLGDALDRRLWRLDPRTGKTVATIDLGFPPTSAAFTDGTLWITDGLHDRVVPVDAATRRVGHGVAVGSNPTGIAVGSGSLWVVNTVGGTLSRIDPVRRRVTKTIDVGAGPRGVALGAGAVWVTRYAS
jgi:YVTN family beta-propeller protein